MTSLSAAPLPAAPSPSASAPPAQAPCGGCGGQAALAFLAQDTNRSFPTSGFPYYHCRRCGSWFLHPVPEDLGRYYPADYHAIPASQAELSERAQAERYKIELVLEHARSGRLLEIGPSYGMFLELARQAGFSAEGMEMDPSCCAWLRSLGFPVRQTADPRTELPGAGAFDVIALWHVFEHLPEPWSVLPALAAALNPGGILVLAQPNPEALQYRVLGRRWTHLDAPRHLHLIPPRLLAERAAACGLAEVACGGNDAGGLVWNRFGWVHSLRNLARLAPLRLGLHILARGLELAAMPLERTGNRGSTYTAVFRRSA